MTDCSSAVAIFFSNCRHSDSEAGVQQKCMYSLCVQHTSIFHYKSI